MLDRFPPEVLGLIIRKIHTNSDLKSLCRVSKCVTEVARRQLYESITFHADDNIDLYKLKDKIKLCCNGNATLIKDICLEAPLNYNLRKRCPHRVLHISDPNPFKDFSPTFIELLDSLKENNLRSLSLNLGCCVPYRIFNFGGTQWATNQSCIQSMSLITDSGCAPLGLGYLDLRPFASLQSFSWKGLSSGDDFESFSAFIKTQNQRDQKLKILELDLIEWPMVESGWYKHVDDRWPLADNFFARDILRIHPGQKNILFRSLETLLLAGVSFTSFENELSHSFNIMNLTTLQLRNCPASLGLLGSVLKQGITLKLKSFQFVFDSDCLYIDKDFEDEQVNVISQLLKSFQGLEDLFLLISWTSSIRWDLIVDGIVNHKSTLKRLIVHERDTENGIAVDGDIPWWLCGDILFHNSKLSCFGTSGEIFKMESAFTKLPSKPQCKILHLRTSWIDLLKQYELDYGNDPEGYDYQDMSSLWSRQKLPLYPRILLLDDVYFDNPHNLVPNSSSRARVPESEKLAAEESQHSSSYPTRMRTKKIANRSNFDGLAQYLIEFARWVFGPEGIAELQILAWGDFAHNGRWSESNVLLCRDPYPHPLGDNFRPLTDSDLKYWDLIDANMDMLSACSPDNVLWTDSSMLFD